MCTDEPLLQQARLSCSITTKEHSDLEDGCNDAEIGVPRLGTIAQRGTVISAFVQHHSRICKFHRRATSTKLGFIERLQPSTGTACAGWLVFGMLSAMRRFRVISQNCRYANVTSSSDFEFRLVYRMVGLMEVEFEELVAQ